MWSNSQFTEDFVTFTEEIFNGKLHFLYSDSFVVNLSIFEGFTFDA